MFSSSPQVSKRSSDVNFQQQTKMCHLISYSAFILLFFLAYSALASLPILYKPVHEHHHADGHYHFNRLTNDTLGTNDLKVLTILFIPNGVSPGVGASSRAITLAKEVQGFFRVEIANKGHGAKNFELVEDSQANVLVLTIDGAEGLAG